MEKIKRKRRTKEELEMALQSKDNNYSLKDELLSKVSDWIDSEY